MFVCSFNATITQRNLILGVAQFDFVFCACDSAIAGECLHECLSGCQSVSF